jgi:hypothetical protein
MRKARARNTATATPSSRSTPPTTPSANATARIRAVLMIRSIIPATKREP